MKNGKQKSGKKSNKKLIYAMVACCLLAAGMFIVPKVLGGSAPVKFDTAPSSSKSTFNAPHTTTSVASLPESNRNPFQ